MEGLLTPSSKVRETLRPYTTPQILAKEDIPKWAYWLKQFSGSPIPLLLPLLTISLFVSGGVSMLLGALLSILTFLYLIADMGSKRREFKWFRLGFDIPLLLFFMIFLVLGAKDSDPTFWMNESLFGLGLVIWLATLYLFTYALDLFPGVNRLYFIGLACLFVYGGMSLFSHLIDWSLLEVPFEFPFHLGFSVSDPNQAILMVALFFPWALAGWMIQPRKGLAWQLFFPLLTCVLLALLLYSQRVEAWLSALGATLALMFFAKRIWTLLGTLLLLAGIIFFFDLYKTDGYWSQNMSYQQLNSAERRQQLKADIELFSSSPVTGVGYVAYKKASPTMNSTNSYFQILATAGMLGFASYMILILATLLFSSRIWNDIPNTHAWHRVLLLAVFGSQVSLHLIGLFRWTFVHSEFVMAFAFCLSILAYLGEAYGRGLVSDDHCL